MDKVVDDLLGCFHLSFLRRGPAGYASSRCHKGADAMTELEHPFLIEFAVHSRDGIGVDDKRFRQIADWRKAVARLEGSCLACVPYLLLELEIDRHP